MTILWELLKTYSNRDYTKKLYSSGKKTCSKQKIKTAFEKKTTALGKGSGGEDKSGKRPLFKKMHSDQHAHQSIQYN